MATSRQAALLLAAACLVLSVAGRRVTSPAPLLAGKDTPDAARDAVASLPGAPPLKSKMYSGYITVDEAAGRALFYVLVESEQAPPKDPLVLWLNGGPGCSSIGGGFMTEMGPYYPTPGGKLEVNPTRWNQVANMLYVESPAFVGFSYSNTSADAVVGDKRTADDARKFMLGFYSKFPRYASTAFYVAGESYAGHYVPNLAWAIVKGNSAGIGHIPLKGFLVGNAWTDATIDNKGAADMWLTHALISRSTYDSLVSACNLSDVGPLLTDDPAADCDAAQDSAFIEMGNINIYEIYADICPGDFAGARKHAPAAWKPRTARALASSLGLRAAARGPIPAYDPCIDDETASYLNLPEVQEALHANVSGSLPGPWSEYGETTRVEEDF